MHAGVQAGAPLMRGCLPAQMIPAIRRLTHCGRDMSPRDNRNGCVKPTEYRGSRIFHCPQAVDPGGILALRAHCALLLDYVPPKEPPGTPLGNAYRIR